jgi:hypothetical protein
MKYTLSWFIIIAVIVGGVWFFWSQQAVAPTDVGMLEV